MHEFLELEDCAPNLNTVTIAGEVRTCTPMKAERQDLVTALAFTVIYRKHWPNDQVQKIPIRCSISGRERIEPLTWLKGGVTVVVHGELTGKGTVYAHVIERPYEVTSERKASVEGR